MLGINTPAMFSSDLSNLMEAFLTAYTTFPLNYGTDTETSLQRTWPRLLRRMRFCIICPCFVYFKVMPS